MKTFDIYRKKIPKNSHYIYKSKTPNKKFIYHKKKKKRNNDNSKQNNSNYETNISSLKLVEKYYLVKKTNEDDRGVFYVGVDSDIDELVTVCQVE